MLRRIFLLMQSLTCWHRGHYRWSNITKFHIPAIALMKPEINGKRRNTLLILAVSLSLNMLISEINEINNIISTYTHKPFSIKNCVYMFDSLSPKTLIPIFVVKWSKKTPATYIENTIFFKWPGFMVFSSIMVISSRNQLVNNINKILV